MLSQPTRQTNEESMRRFRTLLTVCLGVALALDTVIAYRVWDLGFPPKRLVLEDARSGAARVMVQPVPFTLFDYSAVGIFLMLHAALAYLVWRSWKAKSAP